jgi:hypothetical protein
MGGAFASTALILRFGNNYSFFLTPVLFVLAGILWQFVSINSNHNRKTVLEDRKYTRVGPLDVDVDE